jgi:lysophospholipase L1-like esterase
MSNEKGSGKKRLIRGIGYGFYVFVAVFLLLEVALRLYNPFHLRLKGDRIILPINLRMTITNRINPKLDPVIVNTRNSLGFRGPEPPENWKTHLTIITIGGSTTECHFLSDDKTWPFLLGRALSDSFQNCWLNNAGLDGHSTFGHMILLNDHVKKLRPKVILFLTGINDVETEGPSFHDKLATRGAYSDLRHWVFENSEVLNLFLNLARGWRAQKFNNTTNSMLVLDSTRRRPVTDAVMKRRLEMQASFLEGYGGRLAGLADTCVAWNILPVFLTQPNLFGYGRDPLTGANLGTFPADEKDTGINGQLIWEMLEKYNDVTRRLCTERGLPMIDLARLMPKDSRYFYDMSHFTNSGAEEVASLVEAPLAAVLKRRFPQFVR